MDNAPPATTEEPAPRAPADTAKTARLRCTEQRLKRYYRFMPRVWAAVVLLTLILWRMGMYPQRNLWLLPFIYTIFGLYLLVAIMPALGKTWRRELDRSGVTADIQNISMFVEGLEIEHESVFVKGTLTTLLLRLQASDAHLLNTRHHDILNRLLSRNNFSFDPRRMALKLAILKAYEQIGGIGDLPTVKRLAQGEGYAKRDKEIREAAQACLPYLQARSEQQEARQMLLRASDASAASGETLLRPAQATNPTEPQQLLRAASTETLE